MRVIDMILILMISASCLLGATKASSRECVEEPVKVDVSGNLLGANQNIPIDEIVREAARNATLLWNREVSTSGNSLFKVSCVRKAKRQVVSGFKYTLSVTLAETECTKSGDQLTKVDLDECALKSGGGELDCELVYWEKPWEVEKPFVLVDYECHSLNDFDHEDEHHHDHDHDHEHEHDHEHDEDFDMVYDNPHDDL